MFIEMVICAVVDCKSHTRQWRGYFYKFSREENLKQQWVIKIKQKYPIDTTCQHVPYLLLWLKSLLEKGATSVGTK